MFRFRNMVWTAVLAVTFGAISVGLAIAGCSAEVVGGFGVFGLIFAILTPK
jgi:hypothetical protein